MKLLLDTHAFLWFIGGNPNLSQKARQAIENENNQRFLTIASLWEIAIKVSIGKLKLELSIPDLVTKQVDDNDIKILEITSEHLEQLTKLDFHHKDPFDRLIIAQSLVENMTIITKDTKFVSYPVSILW